MNFFVLAALFTAIIAAPANNVARDVVCGGRLYSEPQCCSVDVLGIADLDCNAPDEVPRDFEDLKQICSKSAAAAKCCSREVVGQEILCK
ncbi:hypothetical protein V495_06636 [Pseudogymnoascus sp. VKM F-4514 (FW-929)]|nr:hypothetical protein V495_06636 [Pseudogymnoascus sp. VKM F-4514 (FW-929)]KFY56171.1 hypothetical protein V497_06467 [Pseudogymnoascus sp. VKM F-4516 (FW-969)]